MKHSKLIVGSVVILLMAAPAAASTVITGSCVSVTNAAGCKFSGNINGNPTPSNVNSFKNAEAAYNLFNNSHPSANPDILLDFLGDTTAGFPGTFTGGGTTSGTWSLPGYLVNFLSVKAGPEFILYQLATPASSGTWSTAGLVNRQGRPLSLSHLSFFGTASAVPEPAAWALMFAGFGVAGSAIRRRRKLTVVFA